MWTYCALFSAFNYSNRIPVNDRPTNMNKYFTLMDASE